MKATHDGKLYDTEAAEFIANDPTPDGNDDLYRAGDGEFFLVKASTYLDGRKLKPWEDTFTLAPELDGLDAAAVAGRLRRLRYEEEIIRLSNREAMTWCIKTCVPECFRGYILESI